MEVYSLITFVLLFNFFIFFNFSKISKSLNFFDKPDGNLKKHKHPVSLLGGSLILVLILILKTSYSFGKLYSDKDGKRIEFSSYLGEDLWGKKNKSITSHGILYLPKNASDSSKFPLAILVPGLGGQRGRGRRQH